jgi:hypothetical protein
MFRLFAMLVRENNIYDPGLLGILARVWVCAFTGSQGEDAGIYGEHAERFTSV